MRSKHYNFFVPDIQLSKNRSVRRSSLRGFGDKLDAKADRITLGFRTELGGEYRDRTGDLLRAKQALSQLS